MPMSTKPIRGRVRKAYEFIEAHRGRRGVQIPSGLLGVATDGFDE